MKQQHRFALRTTVAALACAGMGAFAAPVIDANIEFDNTWLNRDRGLSQSGRVEMNVAGKVGTDYFVAARASYMAFRSGSAGVDDMWVQFGSSMADVKLGRFEAADLFPLPRDAIVLYAIDGNDVYRTNVLRGRFGNTADDGDADTLADGQGYFHAAGTLNFGGGMAFELGAIETKARSALFGAGAGDDIPRINLRGLRPVLSFVSGPIKASFGAEIIRSKDTAGTKAKGTGLGATARYDFGPAGVLLNLSAGNFEVDGVGDKLKARTIGLILDMPTPGATVGLIHSRERFADFSGKVNTLYAAYAMPLFGLKGATLTPALSYSKASGDNDAPDEKGVELRINYTF